jgi:hypothetical protein
MGLFAVYAGLMFDFYFLDIMILHRWELIFFLHVIMNKASDKKIVFIYSDSTQYGIKFIYLFKG